MGEDFTLYRGEGGTPHVVAFRCAHRGTQLSTGWVEGDCIRCFYHGWKYDAAGQCVEQPAEDATFAAEGQDPQLPDARSTSASIFAYFGEGDPPPPPPTRTSKRRACSRSTRTSAAVTTSTIWRTTRCTWPSCTATPFWRRQPSRKILEYEETEYGLKIVHRMGQVIETDHRIVPNGVLVPFPPRYAEGSAGTAMAAWRVPIDDETHVNYRLKRVFITGEAADCYRAQQAARTERQSEAPADLAERVLRGEVRIQDLKDRTDIQLLQDDVAMVGQGRIADRTNERLGRSDVSVILQRKIWERELRALAEGRPLKKWLAPRAGLVLPVHA